MSKAMRAWSMIALFFPCGAAIAADVPAQTAQPEPSALEQRILAALDKPTELEFVDQPLSDVVEYLKERHQIEIQIDEKALGEAGLAKDLPVTKNVKGIKLASALDLMLSQLDLNYAIHDEVLLITSKAASEKLVVTRVYPVADLLMPAADQAVPRRHDLASLIELITSSVAPHTWSVMGGRGNVQEFRAADSIVITHTTQAHREVEKLLAGVRAVKHQRAAQQPQSVKDEVQDDATFYVKVYPLPLDWFTSMTRNQGTSGGLGGVAANGTPVQNSQPAARQESLQASPASRPQFGRLGASPPSLIRATAQDLAKAIPDVIEPESWDLNGGEGCIRAFDFKLLVRQTRAVHRQIEELLHEMD